MYEINHRFTVSHIKKDFLERNRMNTIGSFDRSRCDRCVSVGEILSVQKVPHFGISVNIHTVTLGYNEQFFR